jgi:hypothetical protein
MHTFPKGNKLGGRPRGSLNKRTLEKQGMDEFFRQVLESPEYRRNLRKRLIQGMAFSIELLAYHYAYGKPKDSDAMGQTTYNIVLVQYAEIHNHDAAEGGDHHHDSPGLPPAELPIELSPGDAGGVQTWDARLAPTQW